MEHSEWLAETTGGDSARTIAKKSGVPDRTVLNQTEKGKFSAENVIKIATGYGKSPVRALVDTDYLDEQWAETVDPITALRQVSEEDLADEVLRRMKLPGTHEEFDTPVDELDARRAAKSNGRGIYPTPDVLPEGYVADSTDTEPEMGDDDYNDGP
ncbi:hypothetical protein [Corynebacterium provencense]|jgi:hypothetical protein|uniref:hypothetical protein n=1 Tax=Corynebacterium provencense TaxID=1737425 RepID=UPI00082967AF|nr:hypothetical protein [Corynebacterium provencense]